MQSPVQIQFINMDSSEAVEQAVEKFAAKLDALVKSHRLPGDGLRKNFDIRGVVS